MGACDGEQARMSVSREPHVRVLVPQVPALVAGFREVIWLSPEGEIEALSPLPAAEPDTLRRAAGLRAWQALDEWQERAPPPPPGNAPVEAAAARQRLAALLGDGAEPRPQQSDYAAAVAAAFAPRDRPDEPQAVLAEAGTGVGKTLGYIAPASLWAERNDGAVWISTYTRNLQSQIAGELDRLYPDPAQKRRRVVVRKGRENFLCLLNYEEATRVALGRASPGGARIAPLDPRRRGRPVARPRPATPHRRSGRGRRGRRAGVARNPGRRPHPAGRRLAATGCRGPRPARLGKLSGAGAPADPGA